MWIDEIDGVKMRTLHHTHFHFFVEKDVFELASRVSVFGTVFGQRKHVPLSYQEKR